MTLFGIGIPELGFEYYPSWFVIFGLLGFIATTYALMMPTVHKHFYGILNLIALKKQGKLWSTKYKYLKSVFLFQTFSDVSRPDETRTKYTLYFKFKKSTAGKIDEEEFNELTWNPEIEAYPISECKDEIYRIDPSKIDLIYEWNVVTEKPKTVDRWNCFVVFGRGLIIPFNP